MAPNGGGVGGGAVVGRGVFRAVEAEGDGTCPENNAFGYGKEKYLMP